jgi:branched-chain amino acid transport system ATP-binding protein
MLELRGVHTYYGDSHILQGIDLSVGAAQCVALLGRNGAGKTTTLRSIVGLTPRRRGEIVFHGADIGGLPTPQIIRRGIAYVPENRGIFASVTVMEHLRMAHAAARGRPRRRPAEFAFELFPRLAERRQSFGGQLSGGEQQMLAVARALVAGPDLLVLDEPSEGLAPVIVDRLEDVLEQVKRERIPVLLVEQNYGLATRLADYTYVLSQGVVQFAGSVGELAANEEVRRTYLSV